MSGGKLTSRRYFRHPGEGSWRCLDLARSWLGTALLTVVRQTTSVGIRMSTSRAGRHLPLPARAALRHDGGWASVPRPLRDHRHRRANLARLPGAPQQSDTPDTGRSCQRCRKHEPHAVPRHSQLRLWHWPRHAHHPVLTAARARGDSGELAPNRVGATRWIAQASWRPISSGQTKRRAAPHKGRQIFRARPGRSRRLGASGRGL